MIIGIDASKAASGMRTGVENFVFELILALSKVDKKNTYYLFTNKRLPDPLLKNSNFKEIYIPIPKFWNKFRLPLALLKNPTDIYLQPAHTIPAFAPRKTIAVFHDLAWAKFPKAYSKKDILMQKMALKNFAAKAAKIVCVSNSAKLDLSSYMPELKQKLLVIYHGNNPFLKPIDSPVDVLGIKSDYFLSIGRLEERKNTKGIIKAFEIFKETCGSPHKLILIGKPGYGYDKIKAAVASSKYKEEILLPGFVPDDKINDLQSGACAFVFPSFYEGFGLPVIEAMQAKTPVITSNSSSLPEIAGDAAIFVDPKDENAIAKAMAKVAADKKLREMLIEKGLKQAKKFDWSRTAHEYLKLMEEL